MANMLKTAKIRPIVELRRRGWSVRRIARELSERCYDMFLVVPALKRWQSQPLPGPEVAGAFQRLLAEYVPGADAEKGTG